MKRKYWFKRRRYGFGWIPVTWQGWLVVAAYLLTVVASAEFLREREETWLFFLVLVLATVALIRISSYKGPRPRWRWGTRPTDDPDEDF